MLIEWITEMLAGLVKSSTSILLAVVPLFTPNKRLVVAS